MPITCPHCGQEFPGEKLNARHLSKCNPESSQKAPSCLCGHISTSLTQMKRHRQACPVWMARDGRAVRVERLRQTSLERYGVDDARRTPEANQKREETNLGRYGATNPFSRGASTFEAVQAALEGKRPVLRGSDNPFAKPEVQEKIRATMVARFGVENPQQVPEIRAKAQQTNLGRYGVKETLASPAIRERIKATCEEVYGGPAPSCSPGVLAKQQVTNQARYGVPWTGMNTEVRQKQLETMEAKYGSHYLASDEGKMEIRRVMKERYGVEFPGELPDHWEKAVKAFQERYGVDHPLHADVFMQLLQKTCRVRYGADFFLYSPVHRKRNLEKWGVEHPMQNREYARQHLERIRRPGPNMFERRVGMVAPAFLYTGDGSFWRWLPALNHHKNPDFILPGPDPAHPKKGVIKVIEAFGDFWHSRIITGKANFDHEQELISAYAGIGIACLIVWEGELKADRQAVADRIRDFLALGKEALTPTGQEVPSNVTS